MKQSVLVLVKPDGMAKSLVGYLLMRLSETRLRMVAVKLIQVQRELAEAHYGHLRDKPFFDEIVQYLSGGLHQRHPVLAMVFNGEDAIERTRELAGSTNPEEADPRTVRGSCGRITTKGVFENVLHVSSDPNEARREIKLWFAPEEILVELYPTKLKTIKSGKKKVWA